MPHYMLSVHSSDVPQEPMTAEEMHQSHVKLMKIEQEMATQGAWVFSARLHEPATATVVRVKDKDVLTTDGPFAETKEHLGGFYLIKADDLDEALTWATKVTETIRVPIEVRPLADYTNQPRT
jgi:hypothetical protein